MISDPNLDVFVSWLSVKTNHEVSRGKLSAVTVLGVVITVTACEEHLEVALLRTISIPLFDKSSSHEVHGTNITDLVRNVICCKTTKFKKYFLTLLWSQSYRLFKILTKQCRPMVTEDQPPQCMS